MELVGRFFAKRAARVREMAARGAANEATAGIIKIALMTMLCFFMSRVTVAGEVYPCGIAIITVLMNKSRMYLYMLPVLLLSLYTNNAPGVYIWGDFMAISACGLTFMLLGSRRMSLEVRTVIAVLITIICISGYHIGGRMLYRFDLQILVFEVFAITALTFLFEKCFGLLDGREALKKDENGAAYTELTGEGHLTKSRDLGDIMPGAVTAALVLAACGMGIWGEAWGIGVHLPIIAGLLLTLISGYYTGILTGVTAGGASALMLILAAGQPPGTAAVYICGGFVAGYFKGMWRVTAQVCFIAATLSLGLIPQFPEMYIDIVDPVAAGIIFLLIPKRCLNKMEACLLRYEKEDDYEDHILKERLLDIVYKCKSNFEELSTLYGDRGIGSSVTAQQFRGMLQVVGRMEQEIRNTADKGNAVSALDEICGQLGVLGGARRRALQVMTGESGYAGELGISGDSRLCRELSDGRFLMILSDGMGKGEAAAAESGRAVRTIAALLEAGFEVESALKTLNAIMLTRSEREIFTTIDIGIINRRTAQLRLYKIGAATTFIKRKGKVVAVKRKSLPMGIVDGLDIDFVNVRLRPGDQIVMASDGITDSVRSDFRQDWLTAQIEAIRSTDPQTMCDLIINRAVQNYGIREKDDLTVITATIS